LQCYSFSIRIAPQNPKTPYFIIILKWKPILQAISILSIAIPFTGARRRAPSTNSELSTKLFFLLKERSDSSVTGSDTARTTASVRFAFYREKGVEICQMQMMQ